MAKKNNIRSIRFSDEMIEMIESQAGDSFTAKFEALVTRCMWELPQREKELEAIQTRITMERKNLHRISEKVRQMEQTANNVKWAMESYERQMKAAIQTMERLCNTE